MGDKQVEARILLQSLDDAQNWVDDSGSTLLHYTAQHGNTIMTQYLIELGSNIDSLDESGNSPLMLAVNSEQLGTVELLLNANANLNIRDASGRTILESVVQAGVLNRSAEVKSLFLNRVIATCFDDDILIAITLAEARCNLVEVVRLNRPVIVKEMLERGSSVEDRDINWNTTLHVAVELMNLDIIKLLIEHGARINARGYHGSSPLAKYDMQFKDADTKLEILQYLLDQGASLTMIDLLAVPPLTFLLCGGDRQILETVMQYDVDLCAFNNFYQTPMHYLAENRNPGVLEAIRGKNFLVNARNAQGFTPLLLAAKNYDLEKVEFLIEHGADVNAKSPDGHTPLTLLFMNRWEDDRNVSNILELLLHHGADVQVIFQSGMTIFDLVTQNDFFYRIKPVISKLAMCEVNGEPINKVIRDKISVNIVFGHHYDKCKRQINQLRFNIVHGTVSLFKLLFQSEDKLILYARNSEFELKFRRLMVEMSKNLDVYVLDKLNKRVDKAIRIAELKEVSAYAIHRLTNLPISSCQTVLYRIVDYLCDQDLENLYEISINR